MWLVFSTCNGGYPNSKTSTLTNGNFKKVSNVFFFSISSFAKIEISPLLLLPPWPALRKIRRMTGLTSNIFNSLRTLKILRDKPSIDLHLIFEKLSLKNQVGWTWISQATQTLKIKLKLDKKSSSSNWIFQTQFFKNKATYPLSFCTWFLQFSSLKYRVWLQGEFNLGYFQIWKKSSSVLSVQVRGELYGSSAQCGVAPSFLQGCRNRGRGGGWLGPPRFWQIWEVSSVPLWVVFH